MNLMSTIRYSIIGMMIFGLEITGLSAAGVGLNTTRIVFPQNSQSIPVTVRNSTENEEYLVQVYLTKTPSDSTQEKVFDILPPMLYLKPGQQRDVRITETSSSMNLPKISNDLMLVPEFTFTDERRKGLIYPRPAPFDIVTGHFNGWGSGTNQFPWYRNCIFEPYQTTPETIIEHEVFLTGRLLVYGTGNQKSGTYYLKDNIGTSIKDWRNLNEGSWVKLVDKADPINVTVSGLTCSLQTPNKINFGIQDSNAAAGTLLASVQRPIAISCSQFKDQVDAYIGISANVKPEYYSGNNYDVNLINSSNRAAAYVKLFVHHNGAKLPIRLDQTMVELGRIKANENNV
ncbi:TPA: molecular chaperone, partial [Providencia stuartii]